MMHLFAFLPLIILTAPIFRFLIKSKGYLLILVLLGLIQGCTTTSSKFEKSPCACNFHPLNSMDQQDFKS